MSTTTGTGARGRRQNPLLPPYQRIEEQLRARIQDGEWPVGAKLPSRKGLAQEYGVALATIERAISSLRDDGTLRADGARGTFVSRAEGEAALPRPHDGTVPVAGKAPLIGPAGTAVTLGMIGTFSPSHQNETDNFWIRTIGNALEQRFTSAGGTTQFFNRYRGDQPLVSMRKAAEALLEDGINALALILVDDPMEIEEIVSAVDMYQVPLVFITSGEIRRPLPHVFYDNRDAGYSAAQHLIRHGHRHLLFVAPFEAPWVEERIAGVREGVLHAGLPERALSIYPAERQANPLMDYAALWRNHEQALQHYHELGYEFARIALEACLGATGVIAADDYLALDLLKAAHVSGKKVGQDLAIVGFDDNPEARLVGLTSVRPPLEAMGQEAGRLLLLALQGETARLQIRLRSHLIPRLSTRRPIAENNATENR